MTTGIQYWINGQPVGLDAQSQSTAHIGFWIGGQPFIQQPDGATAYSLTAAFGSYTVTGESVTFSIKHGSASSTGLYTVTGNPANLLFSHHYTLNAQVGFYFLYGVPADLHLNAFIMSFSQFYQPSYTDWANETNNDYTSYLETFQNLPDAQLKTQVPYLYTFLKEDGTSLPNSDSALLNVRWDWVTDDLTARATAYEQVYNYRGNFLTSVKKTKIRGKGRSVKVRYTSEPGKRFNLLGWVIFYDTNAGQ